MPKLSKDKLIEELVSSNTQLQHKVADLVSEISKLNKKLNKMVNTFEEAAKKIKEGTDEPLKKKLEEYYNQLLIDYTNVSDIIRIRINHSLPIIATISDDILKYSFMENEIRAMFGHKELNDEELNKLRLARSNKLEDALNEAMKKAATEIKEQ